MEPILVIAGIFAAFVVGYFFGERQAREQFSEGQAKEIQKELDEYKKELMQELCSAYSEVYHQVGKDLIDAIEEEINVRKEK